MDTYKDIPDEQEYRMPLYTSLTTRIKYVDTSAFKKIRKGAPNKVISLFSGAGGLDIGLEKAGFDTAVCIEIDADCRETLKFNRKEWTVLDDATDRDPGDIRKIDVQEILNAASLKRGQAAIVCGGAPCQPFSNIGKKQGKHDPRNGDLFLEFVRVVSGVLPKAFIFENVAGIKQARHSDVIDFMEKKFQEIGYSVSGKILNSCDYGIGQKRERFFMIGLHGSEAPAFPFPTHSVNDVEWSKFLSDLDIQPNVKPKKWETVKQVFQKLEKLDLDKSDDVKMNISDVVVERMKHIGPGENFKVLPMELRPNCWKTGKHQGHDTFGRIEADKPSPTIRTAAYNPSKGKYIHPFENRGLSSHEMAAIQDFPATWKFKSVNRAKPTLVSVGKQIGNAVPPGLAEAIGKALAMQMDSVSR
ncbi:DNA cytosine methyltransferase [Terasakiella sp.]|uniref:DNA cytosine methyltransferase n=1 Tax=Terasakiella sp. TaxID=2034861 RepID=UPI003AA89509